MSTKIGTPRSNMTSDINDAGFKDEDIGNWVAYSDGSGTPSYDGVNPDEEKVAKITVAANPNEGTYTGMRLPTSAISTFTDGTTYRLRARIYIPSSNNNWTKISILPDDMLNWTKVSEILANITVEDKWQTVEAFYTASSDITGYIAIKGESTTAGNIFYTDDIEITTD